ncbi:MAG: SUMF1/EgtB/PvdO family nonheme iron enzyme [Cyclobacteriaceae bacterium]|jgi:formylglycine-generating enzyme required for sulfatase activity|nr:SUMF1/EgtB/PvdO family nonheme iron enzyme [Cyclobacteriaceae bacterium]
MTLVRLSRILFAITFTTTLATAQDLEWEKHTLKNVRWQQRVYPVNRAIVRYQIGEKIYDAGKGPLQVAISKGADPIDFVVLFTNPSKDTIRLTNVVPFSPGLADTYITGLGDHRLSRTHLFSPGRKPVNVIVPDNAWELGFSSMALTDSLQFTALVRRELGSMQQAVRKRFETILMPGGSVAYHLYAEIAIGTWREALKKVFQENRLYDVASFDESMYRREDLAWIKEAYVMHLIMAWDKDYYQRASGQFQLSNFQKRGKALYGGDDVIGLWPTWPTLGLDQRNQFDMYRDLPGGLSALRQLADTLRRNGSKFFVAYNPWDESTRRQSHLQGLADLIRDTSADGVVLDTKGESSAELQQAADGVRKGVIMYSEGMAVPRDMVNIVSGRVHNALYYPPMLNLNKLIRPDFAIFRVAEVFKEPIQREYAVAFFNGYGTEINQFAPGHPEWEDEQYKYLGKTTRILRENSSNFTSRHLTVLYPTLHDSIWVNHWSGAAKHVYTIFSLKPEGFDGPLLHTRERAGYHWMDLMHHEAAKVTKSIGGSHVSVSLDPFHKKWLGTNNEGEAGCLAELPELLNVSMNGYLLQVAASQGTSIRIWKGVPDYASQPVEFKPGAQMLDLRERFGRYEGKVVVQLMDGRELLDEQVLRIKPGIPRLVAVESKPTSTDDHRGMVKIPAGTFLFKTTHGDDFIPYPADASGNLQMKAYWMDKFPVTNVQYLAFAESTGYQPKDTTNYLKHWKHGKIPVGQENYPVVYVSREDAMAYAHWAGKRLPTEAEWQYAAQAGTGQEWPWKQSKPVTRKLQYVTETLTVSSLEGIDPKLCNLGTGSAYAVGSYPRGANPFGLQDLVGNVWQLTTDIYESGSYTYGILKGGSYFKPSSSWWYVQGGPRELHYRQALLLVSPGFERNATVGFRCVSDQN